MATYYLVLTTHGSERLAQAQAGTRPFEITQLALGDANGQPYLPSSRISTDALVNERARVDVTDVSVVGQQVEVAALIGSEIGGFNVHEIALLDDQGKAVYLGNYHGGYRPILTEGAGGDLQLMLVLATNGLAPVVIQMNPTTVVADRQWVIDHFVSIPTFDAHVTQNALEHANLLLLIQQLTAMLAQTNEELMDTQVVQQIQQTLILMQQRLTALEQDRLEDIEVGDVLITTLQFADEHAVAAHKGYGTWRAEATGRYVVGAGVGVDADGVEKTIAVGDTLGAYFLTQTAAQVGAHTHPTDAQKQDGDTIVANGPFYDVLTLQAASVGENQAQADVEPMPINPPYQAFGFWRRMT
ncbi:MAG: hypothetical protein RLY58_847 [Pseudomonadota bacterium]|jgi:hypothetical protein